MLHADQNNLEIGVIKDLQVLINVVLIRDDLVTSPPNIIHDDLLISKNINNPINFLNIISIEPHNVKYIDSILAKETHSFNINTDHNVCF